MSNRRWRTSGIAIIGLISVLVALHLSGAIDMTRTSSAAHYSGLAPSSALDSGPGSATDEDQEAPDTMTPDAPPLAPTYVLQGAGTMSTAPGTSAVLGTGPLLRFMVQTEDGINVDGTAFAQRVEATLGDPRSWGADGRNSFQRVDSGPVDFIVMLVSPVNVEGFCPGAGTGGYTSCRYQERVVINLARWTTAVPEYQGDIATYRSYVVNHEVGHELGHPHEPCPGPGQLAPVMQQQTLGLEGCLPNGWPYP